MRRRMLMMRRMMRIMMMMRILMKIGGREFCLMSRIMIMGIVMKMLENVPNANVLIKSAPNVNVLTLAMNKVKIFLQL